MTKINATMAVDLGRYQPRPEEQVAEEASPDPAEAIARAAKVIEVQRTVASNIDLWGKEMKRSFKGILTSRERVRFLRASIGRADD